MTVENADLIHQLDAELPADTGPPREGAEHLRLIKDTLKATFANVEGAVTVTHEEINQLAEDVYATLSTSPLNTGSLLVGEGGDVTELGKGQAGDVLTSTASGVDWEPPVSETNLGTDNRTANNLDITSSTGDDITLPPATTTQAGLMGAADKSKLNGVEAGAEENPQTATQAEAEAGTVTDERLFTPQRIGQAIAALAPSGGGGSGTTNLSIANRLNASLDVASSTGTDATIPSATDTQAGLLTASNKRTIDTLNTPPNIKDVENIVDISARVIESTSEIGQGYFFGEVEGERKRLFRINKSTGVATAVSSVFADDVFRAIAISPLDGTMYAVDGTNGRFFVGNKSTGAFTEGLADTLQNRLVSGMSFTPDGRLYTLSREFSAFEDSFQVHEIDLTGSISYSLKATFSIAGLMTTDIGDNRNGALAIDSKGDFYAAVRGPEESFLIRIDVANQKAVRIGSANHFGVTGAARPEALAFDSVDTLYMMEAATNRLYTLNLTTGVATAVDATLTRYGLNVWTAHGMAFDLRRTYKHVSLDKFNGRDFLEVPRVDELQEQEDVQHNQIAHLSELTREITLDANTEWAATTGTDYYVAVVPNGDIAGSYGSLSFADDFVANEYDTSDRGIPNAGLVVIVPDTMALSNVRIRRTRGIGNVLDAIYPLNQFDENSSIVITGQPANTKAYWYVFPQSDTPRSIGTLQFRDVLTIQTTSHKTTWHGEFDSVGLDAHSYYTQPTINVSGDFTTPTMVLAAGRNITLVNDFVAPGGIVAGTPFVTEWEGFLVLNAQFSASIQLELETVHSFGNPALTFTHRKPFAVSLQAAVDQTVPMNAFNSRSDVMLGSYTPPGTNTPIEITQAHLDAHSTISYRIKIVARSGTGTAINLNMNKAEAIGVETTSYQLRQALNAGTMISVEPPNAQANQVYSRSSANVSEWKLLDKQNINTNFQGSMDIGLMATGTKVANVQSGTFAGITFTDLPDLFLVEVDGVPDTSSSIGSAVRYNSLIVRKEELENPNGLAIQYTGANSAYIGISRTNPTSTSTIDYRFTTSIPTGSTVKIFNIKWGRTRD